MTPFKNLFKKKQHIFVTDLTFEEATQRIDSLIFKRDRFYVNDKSILGKVEANGSFKLNGFNKTTDVRRPAAFDLVGNIYTDNNQVCVYFKIKADLTNSVYLLYPFMSIMILFFVQKHALIIWLLMTCYGFLGGVYEKNKVFNRFKTLLEKALYS